jgi:hypothetical protein
MMTFLTIVAGVGFAALFVALFRAEGLLAFYVVGVQLVLLAVSALGIPWSTAATGAIRLVVFPPLLLWWWLERKDPQAWYLPRRFGPAVWAIMSLFALWELKYFLEGQYLAITTRYEYYKWAYIMEGWGGAFALGVLMPVTLPRLRRFLGAMGFIGASLGLVLLGSVLAGGQATRYDMQHYTPAERASGLGLGVFTGVGSAALLSWLVLANEMKRSQRRTIFAGIVIGIMFLSIMVTASRGPMAAMILTVGAAMLIVGGRRAIGLATAVVALGGILYVGWDLLPEQTKYRLFGTFFIRGEGVYTRLNLLKASFRMLEVAPFFGRTREVVTITGFSYSHQIISHFMVELGLVGLSVFLVCFIPSVFRWFKAILHKRDPIWPFAAPLMVWFAFTFIQRNVAGDLSDADFWVLMGIMMGHRLIPTVAGLSPEASAYWEAQAIYDQEGGYPVPAAGVPA